MKELEIENKLPHPSIALRPVSVLEKFLESEPFFYSASDKKMFVEAMKEAFSRQEKSFSFLRSYFKTYACNPQKIDSYFRADEFPFIAVNALKERDLSFLKPQKMALELKSSGTSGQVSRMQLDRESLLRVRRMAWRVFEGLGLCDIEKEYDYLCFTYDPQVAKDVGTAWTDKLLTSFTRAGEVFYTFRWDASKKEFYFDIESSLNKLHKSVLSGKPLRLIGFPAFALKLTEEYRKKFGSYPKISPQSFVITGGGWKTLADEAIDKKIYRKILADNLGISVENVRDLFGMVEHGVPYVDCRLGNFHIPIYGRVIARHPSSLKPLGYGETGLLQFMTPYLTSYPSLSLLSSDWGSVEEKCTCGLKGPVLVIKGRAGVKKLKGCAVSASQML
ncbi:MAG: long-chain-fatty-acid--CoA ligase [Elusimicrobiota bacterium]